MKLIGVVSDTHFDSGALKRCVERAGEVDIWCHLGDLVYDAETLAEISGKPVYAVRGNCDIMLPQSMSGVKNEAVVEAEGAKLLLVHGHTLGVEYSPRIRAALRAEELGCSALLYGHTHVSEVDACGALTIVNPGSPSRPRCGRKPSFALLEADNGRIRAKIITL